MLGVGAFSVVTLCPSAVGYCCDELALPTTAGMEDPPYVSYTNLWRPKGLSSSKNACNSFVCQNKTKQKQLLNERSDKRGGEKLRGRGHDDEVLEVDGGAGSFLLLDDLPEQQQHPAIDDDQALYNEWVENHLQGLPLPPPHLDDAALPASSCCYCCNQLAEANMDANGMVPSCNEPSNIRVVATQGEAAALVVGGGLAYTSSSLLPPTL